MPRVDQAAEGVGAFPRTRLGRGLVGVRARLRRRRLDAVLAAGGSPWSSPDLVLRAAELTSPQERRQVVRALETLVECAEQGRAVSRYLKLREQEVLLEREGIVALAARVASPEPVAPAVMAQLEWLLWSESSPFYTGGESPEVIGHVLRHCLDATR